MSHALPDYEPYGPVEPPPPPETPRRRRGVWIIVGVAVLLVLAGGAVAGTWLLAGRSGTPAALTTPTVEATTTTAAPAPTTPAVLPAPALDLVPLLLARPVGATTLAVSGTTKNALTIDQVAADFQDEASIKAYLQAVAFRSCAARGWRKGSQNVIVRLYQIADPPDADDFARALHNFSDVESREGIPSGGVYLAIKKPTGAGALFPGMAYVTKNNVIISIFVATTTKDATHARVLELLTQQADRIKV